MAQKRVRDYAAEYARRVQRGEERGLTRKAARGHAPEEVRKAQRTAAPKGKGGRGRAAPPEAKVKGGRRPAPPSAPAKKRDYKAEYQRRLERLEAAGLTRSVARGHPRRGELGAAELRQLRAAVRIPSPSGWRLEGGVMTRGPAEGDDPLRKAAADRVAALLEIRSPVGQGRHELLRRRDDAKAYVELLMAFGVSEQQAYTFWFSP